jgi:hypothetical protein
MGYSNPGYVWPLLLQLHVRFLTHAVNSSTTTLCVGQRIYHPFPSPRPQTMWSGAPRFLHLFSSTQRTVLVP